MLKCKMKEKCIEYKVVKVVDFVQNGPSEFWIEKSNKERNRCGSQARMKACDPQLKDKIKNLSPKPQSKIYKAES